MIAPSDQKSASGALGGNIAGTEAPSLGYVTTNEMYSRLYDMYYQRCARNRVPCLVVVRNGGHCRVDLDMTCSHRELTRWAQDSLSSLFEKVRLDEFYTDNVYCWAARVPNRIAEGLAKSMLAVLEDERASQPA